MGTGDTKAAYSTQPLSVGVLDVSALEELERGSFDALPQPTTNAAHA
jgi:hypothetical protein